MPIGWGRCPLGGDASGTQDRLAQRGLLFPPRAKGFSGGQLRLHRSTPTTTPATPANPQPRRPSRHRTRAQQPARLPFLGKPRSPPRRLPKPPLRRPSLRRQHLALRYPAPLKRSAYCGGSLNSNGGSGDCALGLGKFVDQRAARVAELEQQRSRRRRDEQRAVSAVIAFHAPIGRRSERPARFSAKSADEIGYLRPIVVHVPHDPFIVVVVSESTASAPGPGTASAVNKSSHAHPSCTADGERRRSSTGRSRPRAWPSATSPAWRWR